MPLGKSSKHGDYVFGVQTTKGIINGGVGYPIRSLRDTRYRYIRNPRPDLDFTKVLTDAKRDFIIEGWEKIPAGAARAASYRRRPADELYDLDTDPYELKNLTVESRLAAVRKRLPLCLDAWMKQQGDEGWATGIRAGERRMKGPESAIISDARPFRCREEPGSTTEARCQAR